MKRNQVVSVLVAAKLTAVTVVALLVMGCETAGGGRGPATQVPAKQVEIFKDGKEPDRNYTVLRTLMDDGREVEEAEIEAKMVKTARKLGADALFFEPKKESGFEAIHPFTFGVKKTYLFKARAVRYQ